MSNTTTLTLVFRIVKDVVPPARADRRQCTQADLDRLDAHLNGDGDCLSLEGGRFNLVDEQWSTPDLLNGRLYVQFEVEVEGWEDDDMDDDALAAEVYDAAILHLPEGLDVASLEVTTD